MVDTPKFPGRDVADSAVVSLTTDMSVPEAVSKVVALVGKSAMVSLRGAPARVASVLAALTGDHVAYAQVSLSGRKPVKEAVNRSGATGVSGVKPAK